MTNYNLTQLTNATDFAGVVSFANDATNSLLVSGFYIALFLVILISLKRYEFTDALLVSSWVTTVGGYMLMLGDWLNPLLVLFFLVVAAFTTLYKIATEGAF